MKLRAPRCRYPLPARRPDGQAAVAEGAERRRECGDWGHPIVVLKRWSKRAR